MKHACPIFFNNMITITIRNDTFYDTIIGTFSESALCSRLWYRKYFYGTRISFDLELNRYSPGIDAVSFKNWVCWLWLLSLSISSANSPCPRSTRLLLRVNRANLWTLLLVVNAIFKGKSKVPKSHPCRKYWLIFLDVITRLCWPQKVLRWRLQNAFQRPRPFTNDLSSI